MPFLDLLLHHQGALQAFSLRLGWPSCTGSAAAADPALNTPRSSDPFTALVEVSQLPYPTGLVAASDYSACDTNQRSAPPPPPVL